MTQKEITIGGQTYPVVFNFDAMMIFEEVADKQFFKANFEHMKDRMSLVFAAALAADEKTTLTIQKMKGDGSFDAVREVIEAFNIVMTITGEFFKVPAVVADEEKSENQTDEKATEEAKN